METLKCKVQDPGFPDTEVTCLKTDDGQTYFFIENGTLKNGNIISTPILKEGIGHAPYTSLGLITPQGEVLIPFENKNIKPLSNELLLVEKNTPTTDSVVEALNKQNDPLSASELIETANTIKSQMKSVMGPTSTYAFDNQFSEAALYTTAGVNLANDYFSFIANDNGSYYMSKNVVGSPISKYDPYAVASQTENASEEPQIPEETSNENQTVEAPMQPQVNETAEASVDNTIPNSTPEQETQNQDMDIPVPGIDLPVLNGLNIPQESEAQQTIPENVTDNSNDNNIELPNIDIPNVTNEDSSSNSEVENNSNDENLEINNFELPSINSEENQTDSDHVELEIANDDISSETNMESSENEETESNLEIENSDFSESEESGNNKSLENQEEVEEYSNNYSEDTDEGDNSTIDSSEKENMNDNNEDDSDFSQEQEESYSETEIEENQESTTEEEISEEQVDDDAYFEEQIGNPIIANATNTIRKLLEENRNQRQVIDRQEGELDTLNSSNEILKEDNSSKTKEIITLRNSNAKYRSDNTDLTRENNRLKSTIQRQEELIEHLKSQNSALKEQVAGITTLSNVVAEANNLFSTSQEADYGNNSREFSYLDEDSDSYQYTKKAA